ncbi:hypothetical protein UFOVP447_186 [uncultured Caudovirales phage]|uniref:Uncharacterized protein n=1 Tax=uncultured Caudovirales phage TaxID=2100421 RepID=A0A6J5MA97_9CAUD|nr:hypothetical protein UFOVP447_186 [uncultured Caudovirales phage]
MIDSNNQFKKLSHNLIESVRSVMEKKTNKHGHDAVGHEDSDLDNDGDTDKSDEYLHNRRKAIKHAMKKEEVEAPAPRSSGLDLARNVLSKMRNEEAEELDELSTGTLQSYRKKARAQGNAIVDKMKMGGGDWSKDQKDTQTLRKRSKGANMSGKQLVKRGESLKTEEVEQTDIQEGGYRSRLAQRNKDTRAQWIDNRNRELKAKDEKPNDPKKTHEEVEAIDELSHDTLRRYRMKAKSIGDNEKGDINYRAKGRELAGRKTYGGRMAGIEKAKVMAKEEVEAINELSKKTLASYVKGATQHRAKLGAQMNTLDNARRAVADAQGALDDPSHANAMMDQIRKKTKKLDDKDYNRKYGTHMALKKLAKEEVEEIDEALDAAARYGQHHAAIKELMKSIDHHVRNHRDDAHKHKDYRGKKGVHWGHVGDLAQVHSQLADIHDRLAQQGEYKKSMHESIDEAKVDGVAAGSMDNDGHLCATKVFHKEWAEGTPIFSQHAEPDADGNIAWYDVMFEHGIEKRVSTDDLEILMAESHERHGKRKMKEEAELDEARGRPRKNPLPAGKSDEPEPRQHIIQQLQRAKLSMRGGEHVTFKDGTKHHVSGQHAEKILAKYSAMKPAGKEEFQKKIHASHAAFKAEL